MDDALLLGCGALAGPLFTLVYAVDGATRKGYDARRHPVSGLALGGRRGWTQTANFLFGGLLTVVFAVGLWRAGPSSWGALLVAVWGLGLIGAGVFVTDPVSGYPPGSPDLPRRPTRAGRLHDAFSLAGFAALAAACFVFAPSWGVGWAVYSIASGVLFAVVMVAASAALSQAPRLVAVGGLLQRLALTVGWLWTVLLALRLPG